MPIRYAVADGSFNDMAILGALGLAILDLLVNYLGKA